MTQNEQVSVNGQTIAHKAIAAETQNHVAPRNAASSVWSMATNALVVRSLLLQEATRRGLKADPVEVAPGRFETDEEARIRALLDAAVIIDPVDERDVQHEWEKDPEKYRTPPLWEVSHILCACDQANQDARLAAYRRCKSLLSDLQTEPGRFKKLAEQHSDCGSKSQGGLLGQMRPGDTLPEFEASLRTLGEGDIAPKPVRSRHGYHIVRLDALALGRVLPLEVVRPKIRMALEKAKWTQAASAFVNDLATKADIRGLPKNRPLSPILGTSRSAS
ncbi:MAG: peptidylprolyl isomerase [Cohaesibacteraceae bacterium]